MFLTESLNDIVEYRGMQFDIDMDFANILRFTELLEDDECDNYEKIIIGLNMLVVNFEDVEQLFFDDKYKLFVTILKEKLDFNIDEQQNNGEQAGNNDNPPPKKEYDFAVDGERIYASFLMDYGIDLIEQQGKLHWKKFLALFEGLSEKTPFMQVVHIRTKEVPKPNKHNAKERKRIQELQRKYALHQTDLESGLDQAASFLRRNAKVGED